MTVLLDKRVDVASLDLPGVVYHLRVPSVAERSEFKAAVLASGGQEPNKVRLVALMPEAINALMPDDTDKEQREKYLEQIAAYQKQMAAAAKTYTDLGDEKTDKDHKAFLKAWNAPAEIMQLEAIVSEHYEPYSKLASQMLVYSEKVGLSAARMFLMGWSGLDKPFSRKLGRVEDHTLEPVSSRDLVAIGERIQELVQPSKATLGNSVSAAGGSPGQPTSTSQETSATPKPIKHQKTEAGGVKS